MKTCMCCKTDAALDAHHCLHCGEGSWLEAEQPVTKPTGPKGAPGRLAAMAAAAAGAMKTVLGDPTTKLKEADATGIALTGIEAKADGETTKLVAEGTDVKADEIPVIDAADEVADAPAGETDVSPKADDAPPPATQATLDSLLGGNPLDELAKPEPAK